MTIKIFDLNDIDSQTLVMWDGEKSGVVPGFLRNPLYLSVWVMLVESVYKYEILMATLRE